MNNHLNKPIEVEKLYKILLKYISKKVDVVQKKTLELDSNIFIPELTSVDTKLGVQHLAGNKKLYMKILNDFKNNYKDIKLQELNEEDFKRATHTIKGLSANIGAVSLYKIATQLDTTQNKGLLEKFYREFYRVMDELEEKIVIKKVLTSSKIALDKELKDALFT